MDTSGFYSKDFMLRAGKFVFGPGYTLLRQEKDEYTYPVHGWYWFDSAEEAFAAFELTPEEIEQFNLDLPE